MKNTAKHWLIIDKDPFQRFFCSIHKGTYMSYDIIRREKYCITFSEQGNHELCWQNFAAKTISELFLYLPCHRMEKYRERIQSIFAFPLQSLTLFFNLPLPSEYPTIGIWK